MQRADVLIFEDKPEEIEKIKKEFKQTGINFTFFKHVNKYSKEPFDRRLKKELENEIYKDISLIICDSDLSDIEDYIGLSEVVVANVAKEIAIPISLYALGEYKNELMRLKDWSELKIILDVSAGYDKLAAESKIIFEGFQFLRSEYKKITNGTGEKKYTLSEILSRILDRPKLKDRIAQYGIGNKQMLEEILPYYNEDIKKIEKEDKRIPMLLGYCLWNSILRFPGILLNNTATVSYLNIEEEEFRSNTDIKKLFSGAVYQGPFTGIKNYWWRDDLDDIVFKEKCNDGLELVHKKISDKIKNCKCSVDPTKKAGYYCMLTEKPVSAENSKSNISWFPTGADLARISNPKYDELAPWLGLY